jgi:hypothetical protein
MSHNLLSDKLILFFTKLYPVFEHRFGVPVVVCILLLLAPPCFTVVCCADVVSAVAVILSAVIFVPIRPLL